MSDASKNLKIGQVAKQVGVSTRTIRYYEEVGLMGDSRVTSGAVRYYSSDDVLRLKFIIKLKELGITLKEMKEIAVVYEMHNKATEKVLPQLIDILDTHLEAVEGKIEKLMGLREDINKYRMRIVDLLQESVSGRNVVNK